MSSFHDFKIGVTNRISILFESSGLSPLVGKIFGLLLFAPQPLGLQEMADELGVSKAAVSVQVRALEQLSLCYKWATANDRKDYYYVAEDFNLTVLRSSFSKLKGQLTGMKATLEAYPPEEGLREEEVSSYHISIKRFAEMYALQSLVLERMKGLDEEWNNRREELINDALSFYHNQRSSNT